VPNNCIWQHGPLWLKFPDQWPTWDPSEAFLTQLQDELVDIPTNPVAAHVVHTSPVNILQVIDIEKYSSLQRYCIS